MTRRKPAPAAPISRRRFVTMVAAGSAALIASSGGAQVEPPRRRTSARRTPPAKPVTTAEFEKQRAATADVLKTLRAHALPPGGEFAGAFRPVRPARRLGGR